MMIVEIDVAEAAILVDIVAVIVIGILPVPTTCYHCPTIALVAEVVRCFLAPCQL